MDIRNLSESSTGRYIHTPGAKTLYRKMATPPHLLKQLPLNFDQMRRFVEWSKENWKGKWSRGFLIYSTKRKVIKWFDELFIQLGMVAAFTVALIWWVT